MILAALVGLSLVSNASFDPQLTAPMGLAAMVSLQEYQTNYGVLMAGTLISILPVVILFFALQRDFIAGLTSGAVKG